VKETDGSPARSYGARRDRADDIGARAADAPLPAGTRACAAWVESDRNRGRRPSDHGDGARCNSNGGPFAGDGTTVPVTRTAHPAVSEEHHPRKLASVLGRDDLNGIEAGSVRTRDKRNACLGIAPCAHQPLNVTRVSLGCAARKTVVASDGAHRADARCVGAAAHAVHA